MTFKSPSTGDPVPLSFIIPKTQDDLLKRRKALEITAEAHHGILGRTPDYVNIQVTATRQMAELHGHTDKRFGDNLIAYHENIRENDLSLTHCFGHPQVNRGVAVGQQPDPYIPIGVVDTTSEGIILRGAKLLATLAPFSDEIFVPPYRPLRGKEEEMYALGFAIPTATKGLSFICRESWDTGRSTYDQPLSSRFDEMDALAVFDDVLVPWDRVFCYGDVELHNHIVELGIMWRQYMQHVAVKNIAKLEFALGMTHAMVEAIGIGVHAHVQEKVAEIIDTTETVRSYLRAMEADAGPWMGEGIWLSPEPTIAMRHWAPDAYQRVTDIMQQLAAGGLMLTPTEADMESSIRPVIDKYFQGAKIGAYDRVRLFRLVWDFIGTQFGSRQILYERYFNGDVVRLRQGRFQTYDYSKADASLAKFWQETDQS
ncbi:MAG: 4-hydroxyphenylacetate 3-monooxygenase, oxygenase component, partial [SAR202 cluster bacterium]|nr:4-hydroxyphenylacetate 3-monooxygenase, oxygenase component [SAR202 cluster bacterium]